MTLGSGSRSNHFFDDSAVKTGSFDLHHIRVVALSQNANLAEETVEGLVLATRRLLAQLDLEYFDSHSFLSM